MDTAVALVQAYLNVNGYFTVAEYPVLETYPERPARTATDLDLLAFRFPSAGCDVRLPGKPRAVGDLVFQPDPALKTPHDRADMIVAEVKEGSAHFNPAARDPLVLTAALARFGCCPPADVEAIVTRLLHKGRTTTPDGHLLRMVAFGSPESNSGGGGPLVLSLDHVVTFLERHLREHWRFLGHAQLKQPAMAFLALREKARRHSRRSPKRRS